jgi:hypothetical protein
MQLAVSAVVATSSAASHAAPELGVFRWNSPDGPANVNAYSTWLGQPVVTPTAFEARTTWDQITGEGWNLQPWSQWVRAQSGRNISLAVPMLPSSGASLSSCSAGQYDAYWTKLANNLAYYGLHWAYLRLGWEMDGGWYAWNAKPGSGKEASYAGCFRRIVQVMRQTQPANQWKFVLNTAMDWSSKSYLDAVWPGDAYVDVVAIDFYDQSWATNTYPYPSNCDAACRLTRQQNAWNAISPKLFTLRDFAIAHGKKVAIPEWAVFTTTNYPNSGGDNPYFIQKMYDFISNPANNVAFHAYFDVTYTGFNGQLSGSTSFPQSAALFKQLFGSAMPSDGGSTDGGSSGVTFAAPAENGTLTGAYKDSSACEVIGTGISRVIFHMDGTQLNTENAAPWQCSFDTRQFANGTHTLKAVAYYSTGASTTVSRSVNIQNGTTSTNTPPTVAITSPSAGQTVSGTVAYAANATDNAGVARVDFSVGATALLSDTSAPYGGSVDTTKLANGSHVLKAVAYDAQGLSSATQVSINVQNGIADGGPTGVVFTAPAEGGTLSGAYKDSGACEVTGTGISRVVFYMDSTQLNTENYGPWQCSFDTRQFANGTHTLKAVAYDSSGQSVIVTRSVNVQNSRKKNR